MTPWTQHPRWAHVLPPSLPWRTTWSGRTSTAAVPTSVLRHPTSPHRRQHRPTLHIGAGQIYLQNAGLFWLPLIAVALLGAALFMNNLTNARSTFKEQRIIVARKHTWVMSWLYVGTFGSFIGYSAAFPLLLKVQFPEMP